MSETICARVRETVGVSRVGVSRAYLARLEMGRHDPPLSRLRKLAKALGVPLAELLG